MVRIHSFSCRRLIPAALFLISFPGMLIFAQDKKTQAPAGNTLAYNYPVNKSLSYVQISKVIQNMEVNGQAMQTNVNTVLGITVKALGPGTTDSRVEVRIDSMSQNIDSPAGVTGGSFDALKGKTFNILVSVSGKITDASEAEKITFDAGTGVQSNVTQIIENFFPVLPAGQIAPGYKWSGTDSINSKTATVTTTGIVTSDNTFEGYEAYKGVNCAKITSVINGTRIMKTQSQGMDIKITGPFSGTTTVFFAPAEGYFLKQEVTSKMNGTIEVSAAEGMTFPLIMDTIVTKELK
jgi:hypothetical protein